MDSSEERELTGMPMKDFLDCTTSPSAILMDSQ